MPHTRTGTSSQPPTADHTTPPPDTPTDPPTPRRTTRSSRRKVHWADQLADRLEKDAMARTKKGATRKPPPKPVRLAWGPSTVVHRAGMKHAYRLWEFHQDPPVPDDPPSDPPVPDDPPSDPPAPDPPAGDEESEEDLSEKSDARDTEEKEDQEVENYEDWQNEAWLYTVALVIKAKNGYTWPNVWAKGIGGDYVGPEFEYGMVALMNSLMEGIETHRLEPELQSIMVYLKGRAARATRKMVSLQELSLEE